MTDHLNESISLDASICLGKLGVKNSQQALNKLKFLIEENQDWSKKSLALEVLLRQFNAKNLSTLQYTLDQLQNSPIYISRVAATKLLTYIGPSLACSRENVDMVYSILEERLYEDAIREVRYESGQAIKNLQLLNRCVNRIVLNLQSEDENVRSKAVIALVN